MRSAHAGRGSPRSVHHILNLLSRSRECNVPTAMAPREQPGLDNGLHSASGRVDREQAQLRIAADRRRQVGDTADDGHTTKRGRDYRSGGGSYSSFNRWQRPRLASVIEAESRLTQAQRSPRGGESLQRYQDDCIWLWRGIGI